MTILEQDIYSELVLSPNRRYGCELESQSHNQ